MGLLAMFAQPFMSLRLPPPNSFDSQTVIITGGNTGLGLETARHLVSLGASKVILGVRSLPKGLAAKRDIESTTGKSHVVEVWEVDLENFASVKSFSQKAAGLVRLDVAIMNAGLASGTWNVSSDGWERQLQVNVLSTTLLGLMLLPILMKTGRSHPKSRPHLVLVGSDIHEQAKFNEKDSATILQSLNDEKMWETSKSDVAERYSVTKLLDLYATLELASLSPSTNGDPLVIVNCVAPGFCKSELLSREPGAPLILKIVQFLTARTCAEGSKTLIDAASRGNEAHGKYLNNQRLTKPGALVTSEEGIRLRKRVWSEILDVLRNQAPEVEDLGSF